MNRLCIEIINTLKVLKVFLNIKRYIINFKTKLLYIANLLFVYLQDICQDLGEFINDKLHNSYFQVVWNQMVHLKSYLLLELQILLIYLVVLSGKCHPINIKISVLQKLHRLLFTVQRFPISGLTIRSRICLFKSSEHPTVFVSTFIVHLSTSQHLEHHSRGFTLPGPASKEDNGFYPYANQTF